MAPRLRLRSVHAVDQAASLLGFAPALRIEGLIDTDVTPQVADQVVAVIGEALGNVARHARARQVDVSIALAEGVLAVTVTDDGLGIPQTGRRSGLRNLAERAEQLGGEMSVTPRSDGGTRLEW